MADIFKDFIQVTRFAGKNTFGKINKIYMVFIFVFLDFALKSTSIFGLIGNGALTGILTYLLEVFVLCFIAQSLRSLVVYGNSGKKSIANSPANFFQPLLSTAFYLYLLTILVSMLTMGANLRGVIIVNTIVKVLSAALLEEVYINNKMGFDALKSSFKFVVDNPLTYGLYALIFVLLETYVTYKFAFAVSLGASKFLIMLLLSLIHSLACVFKGHLFKYIDENPYRQRKFMRG
ncbi:MAG: hypothetical protein Q4D88_04435 [Anaerococcus sp.]|nr:hypothetical protein [Anaerococcus sp.]